MYAEHPSGSLTGFRCTSFYHYRLCLSFLDDDSEFLKVHAHVEQNGFAVPTPRFYYLFSKQCSLFFKKAAWGFERHERLKGAAYIVHGFSSIHSNSLS